MAISVNVTISMSPEMVQKATEQAEEHGMSRSEYLRHLIRQADDSPYETPEKSLFEDENDPQEVSA